MAKIFDPINIGKLEVKNRIMFAPTMTSFANLDGSVSRKLVNFLGKIAAGGVGIILTGHAFIDDIASKGYRRMLGCNREGLGLNKIAKEIKKYDCACLVQLNHTGPKADPSLTKGLPRGPVSAISDFRGGPTEIQMLSVKEIEEIVKAYAIAAVRVEEAGFDGLEIHGAHNYLISQFISPKYNLRTDRYGGNLEGRLTFPLEVLSSIKDHVRKNFIIGFRYNAAELIEGGLPLEEGINIGQILEREGVHYLNVSQTSTIKKAALTTTFDKPGAYTYIPAKVKEKVSIPVVGVGAIHEPELIERVLEENKMDIVAICRGIIADPYLVKKIKEGRPAEQRLCIRCGLCLDRTWKGIPIMCSINPMVGRALTRDLKPISESKRKNVIIVGGGVAGMEAARVAAIRGHNVSLYEMRNHTGGQVFTASVIKDMQVFRSLVKYYDATLDSEKVNINLNYKISADEINKLQPDAVVIATGAKEKIPDIPGANQANGITGTSALLGSKHVKGKVAVVGASMIGCQVALHLANTGCKVNLINRYNKSDLAAGLMLDTNKVALLHKISDKDTKIYNETDILEVKEKTMILKNSEGREEEVEIDYIVFTEQFVPVKDITPEMIDKKIKVFQAGDCIKPKNIFSAIHQGAMLERETWY